MFNNQTIQDELETLQDVVQQQQQQPNNNNNTFYPKTLRLSSSSSSSSSSTNNYNSNLPPRRNSCSDSLRTTTTTTTTTSSTKLKTSEEQIQILPITRTSRTGSIIIKRLRTKSLERKPREYLNQHRKSSSYNGVSSDTFYYNSDPRHSFGFHSHIPIERTVLSVLAPNRSRKPSIDWPQTGTETPISRPTNDSERSSSNNSSSNSPQSTLATSINSNETPTRTRYQPRPLLLSAFGTSKLHYNNNHTPDQIESISSTHQQQQSKLIVHSKNLHHYGQTNSLISLDRTQKIRQEKLLAHQAKKLQRRIREAELKAISSSNRNRTRSIPEADEDQDCWCWLSCSDAEDGSQQEGGGGGGGRDQDDQDDDAEEIAVVWRASLDVGRRVSKNRKALGRGHGIRPPVTKDSHLSTIQRPSGNSNTNNTTTPHHPRWPLMFGIQSLMPHHLIKLLYQSRRWFPKQFKTSTSAPFLFGSGLMSGLVLSVLSSTLFCKLPSFLQQRFLPISTEGIGFFFHLIFPNAHCHLYSSPIHFSIGTSLGLYSQW